MIDLYTNTAAHQTKAMRLLRAGLESHGIKSQLKMTTGGIGKGEACVLWGTRYLERADDYDTAYILEAGYYGKNRLSYYSLGINGLNGRADFKNNDSPSDRWLTHGTSRQPWKDRGQGQYVLVMGQVPGDMATRNVDLKTWYNGIIGLIKQRTSLPVCFRPHPKSPHAGPPAGLAVTQGGSLEQALQDAAYVVTFNSNSGVDAALAGVPVYAQDQGSMAWPIAAHTLDALFDFEFKDRSQWLYNLAYTQWTADELSDGTAWSHICHKHEDATETMPEDQQQNR